MTEFINNLIGNDLISSIIVSLIPLIELKGGIVFARGVGFSFIESLGLCYLGSTFVFFPIFFLLRPVLDLLKKNKAFEKFTLKVEGYFESRAEKVIKKNAADTADTVAADKKKKGTLIKCVGVFFFVAVPLPMTGVWTGTAIAVFLGLKFKDAVLPVISGNAVAGLLISALAELCVAVWDISALDYVLWGLFALAAIILVITLIKMSKVKTEGKADE